MANLTTYDDEQVAHALAVLAANRGNAQKTARALGISRSTLRGWAGRMTSASARPKQVDPRVAEGARALLAEKYRSRAEQLLDAAGGEDKIAKAGVKDLLIASGIAIEKSELLSGGPTSRSEVRVSLMPPGSLRERSRGELRVLEGEMKVIESGKAYEDRTESDDASEAV